MCSRNMRKMPRNLHTKNKGKNNNNTARPLGQNETKVYELVQVYISVLFCFVLFFFLYNGCPNDFAYMCMQMT